MTVKQSDVIEVRDAFEASATQDTAAMLLSKAHEAFEGGEIDEEYFLSCLGDIETYLWQGGTVINTKAQA